MGSFPAKLFIICFSADILIFLTLSHLIMTPVVHADAVRSTDLLTLVPSITIFRFPLFPPP